MLYYPRNRIDTSWRVLFKAALFCMLPPDPHARQKLEKLWSPRGRSVAFLSVRTGFDAVLRSMPDIQPGDEVIMTAITIPPMWQIVENRGLKVVSLDIDPATLAPSLENLQTCLTVRSRILVITHIFGTANNNTALIRFAHENGLYVIEDCAQCFHGFQYHGNPESDLAMFSFGPLKIATALGGSLFHFQDSAYNVKVISRTLKREKSYPRLNVGWFLGRTFDSTIKHVLQQKYVYFLLTGMLNKVGKDIDEIVAASTKAFKGDQWISAIRRRPPAALYSLLRWRLENYDTARITQKANRAHAYTFDTRNQALVLGYESDYHTTWLQPFYAQYPRKLIKKLRSIRIDSSLMTTALAAIPTESPSRAAEMLDHIVYVPLQYRLPKETRQRAYGAVGLKVTTHAIVADWPKLNMSSIVKTKPVNLRELAKVVTDARSEGAVVRVHGRGKNSSQLLGHSRKKTYSVNLDYFNDIIVDPAKKTVEVGARATWDSIHAKLLPHDLAPIVQQSSHDFTIGGSLAANAHGRDVSVGMLQDTVVWIDVMYADGKVKRLTQKNHALQLSEHIGTQGLNSIIVSACLKLTRNDILITKVKTYSVAKFFKLLNKDVLLPYEGLFIARPTLNPLNKFKSIQAISWVPSQTKSHKKQPTISLGIEQQSAFAKLIFNWSRKSVVGLFVRSVLEETMQKQSHGTRLMRLNAMRPPVVPLAVLEHNHRTSFDHVQEFFIPQETAEQFYMYTAGELKNVPIIGYTLRYIKKSASGAFGVHQASDEFAFMLYFTTDRGESEKQFIREKIALLASEAVKLGGRPYLAYAHMLAVDTLRAAYPKIQETIDKMDDVFASDFSERFKQK